MDDCFPKRHLLILYSVQCTSFGQIKKIKFCFMSIERHTIRSFKKSNELMRWQNILFKKIILGILKEKLKEN